MKFISQQLPALAKLEVPLPIVTDDEAGLCHAIDNNLPSVFCVQWWNHVFNSVTMTATSHEVPVYVSSYDNYFIKKLNFHIMEN